MPGFLRDEDESEEILEIRHQRLLTSLSMVFYSIIFDVVIILKLRCQRQEIMNYNKEYVSGISIGCHSLSLAKHSDSQYSTNHEKRGKRNNG